MRVYVNNRDCLSLLRFFEGLDNVTVVRPRNSFTDANALVEELQEIGADVVVQMAPQWEWGRYMELVSLAILRAGMRLFAAEGSLFRWLGDPRRAGTDIGFYLSPWGYSGNSKFSKYLPASTEEHRDAASTIINRMPKWSSSSDRVLILGQIDGDRASIFRGKPRSNTELVSMAQALWGVEKVYFKAHPLAASHDRCLSVNPVDSCASIRELSKDFGCVVSANSTGTVEAICSGIPVMCTGVGPWSGSKIIRPLQVEPYRYTAQEALSTIASLLSIHYFEPGLDISGAPDLFSRALSEHGEFSSDVFGWDAISQNMDPQPWAGKYFWD
jgi:hypothetical protein